MSEGFFDFLAPRPGYGNGLVNRLNLRHRFIVAPFIKDLEQARVLDLACNDGRWCYAAAAAGAREVVGIEARQENLAKFVNYPDAPFRNNITLIEGDIFRKLESLTTIGAHFDVVYILGILYHVMDHYRLLTLVQALTPSIIVIDSSFTTTPSPCIELLVERTDRDFNITPHFDNQLVAPVGVPSQQAMDLMAETLGYTNRWMDWNTVPPHERIGLDDYFYQRPRHRFTCVLRRSSLDGSSSSFHDLGARAAEWVGGSGSGPAAAG